jgi:hypothetical protein
MRRAGEYDYMAYRRYKSLKGKLQLIMDGQEGQRDNTPLPKPESGPIKNRTDKGQKFQSFKKD